MAEVNGSGPAAGGGEAQQNLGVLAQYVKDFSFESPNSPQSLRARSTPTLNISINVNSGQPVNNEAEVELKVEVEARSEEGVLFAIDLTYAGMFRLTNIPADAIHPILMIECPRLLFPFARQIVAEATRNGGFPPLLIEPVDFISLYRQRLAAAAQQAGRPIQNA